MTRSAASRRPAYRRRWARVLALLAIFTGVWVSVMSGWWGAPSPERVRRVVASGELIGLPIREAASRLRHNPPAAEKDTIFQFAFDQVRGWRGPAVLVTVENGVVTQATLVETPVETLSP